MNWNLWIGQLHSWLSIAFVAAVLAIFVTLGFGMEPAEWVYFLPLPPLALLALTGLYMFVLPYTSSSGSGR